MDDVTVFVLAGGQSTRMGRDKALLLLGGQTLLERALALAHRIAPRVAVLGSREKYAATGERIIEDQFSGSGPLAGIHAAIVATDTDLNLILSVDMPFVPLEFFLYLLERARSRPPAQVTVPRVGGSIQATCLACYRSFRVACENRLMLGLCLLGTGQHCSFGVVPAWQPNWDEAVLPVGKFDIRMSTGAKEELAVTPAMDLLCAWWGPERKTTRNERPGMERKFLLAAGTLFADETDRVNLLELVFG